MLKRFAPLLLATVLVFSASATHNSLADEMPWQGVPGAKGHIVMVGGGPRPDSVMRHILQLSGDNSMLVIPMASATPQQTGDAQAAQFLELGAASAAALVLQAEDLDNTEIAQRIASAKGIWFSGGDQNRLMAALGNGVLLAAVKQAYLDGAVISGTSAGTAVISRSMITGDERFPAEDNNFAVLVENNVVTTPGIGLLNNMIVDQHFVMRSRLNRLISVLIDTPESLAAGIDEATALWIQPDGMAEVLGESQVILLQESGGTDNQQIADSPRLQAARDIRLSVLPPGSRFRITDSEIVDISLPD
ncbi:MAG: cyanophycinase [Pseudohongiella sp.]|nr:cyanophycinase [Pseudohongiella sp.]